MMAHWAVMVALYGLTACRAQPSIATSPAVNAERVAEWQQASRANLRLWPDAQYVRFGEASQSGDTITLRWPGGTVGLTSKDAVPCGELAPTQLVLFDVANARAPTVVLIPNKAAFVRLRDGQCITKWQLAPIGRRPRTPPAYSRFVQTRYDRPGVLTRLQRHDASPELPGKQWLTIRYRKDGSIQASVDSATGSHFKGQLAPPCPTGIHKLAIFRGPKGTLWSEVNSICDTKSKVKTVSARGLRTTRIGPTQFVPAYAVFSNNQFARTTAGITKHEYTPTRDTWELGKLILVRQRGSHKRYSVHTRSPSCTVVSTTEVKETQWRFGSQIIARDLRGFRSINYNQCQQATTPRPELIPQPVPVHRRPAFRYQVVKGVARKQIATTCRHNVLAGNMTRAQFDAVKNELAPGRYWLARHPIFHAQQARQFQQVIKTTEGVRIVSPPATSVAQALCVAPAQQAYGLRWQDRIWAHEVDWPMAP